MKRAEVMTGRSLHVGQLPASNPGLARSHRGTSLRPDLFIPDGHADLYWKEHLMAGGGGEAQKDGDMLRPQVPPPLPSLSALHSTLPGACTHCPRARRPLHTCLCWILSQSPGTKETAVALAVPHRAPRDEDSHTALWWQWEPPVQGARWVLAEGEQTLAGPGDWETHHEGEEEAGWREPGNTQEPRQAAGC